MCGIEVALLCGDRGWFLLRERRRRQRERGEEQEERQSLHAFASPAKYCTSPTPSSTVKASA